MKKTFLLAALSLALSVAAAQASTITLGAVPTARTVVNSLGFTLTSANSLVLLGTFDSISFTLDPNLSLQSNFQAATLAGGWHQFGYDTATATLDTGVASTLAINATSKIGGSITDNNFGSTKADFFNGKAVYIWVFNASTVGAATEVGLYTATSATVPWFFSTNGGGVGDSVTLSTTNSGASVIQAVGGFGSTSSTNLTLAGTFTAVPEPSTAFVGAALVGAVIFSFARRRRRQTAAGLGHRAGVLAVLLAALAGTNAMAARNVLLLIADDLGADSSSLTNTAGPGITLPETPNIDALGQSGVVFTRAYARPTCSATRATLLTGRHSFRTGVGVALSGAKPELGDNEYTLPRAFAAHAPQYSLAAFGKWHLGYGANTPLTKGGWTHFAGFNSPGVASYTNWTKITDGVTTNSTVYSTTDQVNDASAWITAQGSNPWVAWVAFNAPHSPFHKPPAELLSPRFASLTGTSADINAHTRLYFEAMVEALDKEIGRLLTVVDRANTDIIFVGDNGTEQAVIQPPFLFAGESHAKFTIFEGGVRVPLLVTGPDVKYVGRNDSLVSTVDIWQLIQELAGIDVAATIPAGVTVDSKSILPALQSNVTIPGDIFDEQFNQSATADGQTLRDEKYKLLRFDAKTERLYNLEVDPYEHTNLLPGPLSADAQSHYNSLKRKFQNYLAIPNASKTRDAFPFPVHRTFDATGGTATLTYDYPQLRVASVHTLWRTNDLNDPESWTPIETRNIDAIPTGTPLTTVTASFTDPNATGGQYFYQVVPSLW